MKYLNTELDKSYFEIKQSVKCSIIIPVYNNANFTKLALKHLSQLSSDHEIIVVDNGSKDHTSEVLREAQTMAEGPKLVYISSPKNLGFGRANNKGYKLASGEYIIFINNDIKVKDRLQDWTNILMEAAEDGSIVCTAGGLLDSECNFVKEGTGLSQTDYWYMSGWCLCAKREVFDQLILDHYSDDKTDEITNGKAWGPWNEKFFLYFEDGDLTWRAKQQNINIKEVSIPVQHIARATGRRYNMFGHFNISKKIFKEEWKEKFK